MEFRILRTGRWNTVPGEQGDGTQNVKKKKKKRRRKSKPHEQREGLGIPRIKGWNSGPENKGIEQGVSKTRGRKEKPKEEGEVTPNAKTNWMEV